MNSRLPTSWRDHDYYAIIGVPAGPVKWTPAPRPARRGEPW
jgi:hypothetical protein